MSISFKKIEILNPKRAPEPTSDRGSWYEYYAGYSPKFAYNLLKSVGLKSTSKVLDPWNGLGTTTLASSSLGFNSIGLDLNPAPLIVAKSLRISVGEKSSIKPLLKEILAKSDKFQYEEDDPFFTWFDANTSSYLRGIEKSIQYLLVERFKIYKYILDNTDAVSDIASFFYVALFRTLRILVDDFIGSNPTWVKKAKDNHLSFSRKIVISIFEGEVEKMLSVFNPVFDIKKVVDSNLHIGNSVDIKIDTGDVDFILSSPPYCTRIDYAVYTMPELAVLGFNSKNNWSDLRNKLIGTTTVPKELPLFSSSWGPTCETFLHTVTNHSSKASTSYYLKNHLQYFDMMYKSIKEVSRVLKKGGGCTLVVQDSYYKEIHNDLPLIITEMAEEQGMTAILKKDFKSIFNMAGMNPRTKKYRKKAEATESVLVFMK